MADFGLSAFALFFMQSASFLAFQRGLEKGQGRSNCQTLFGIGKIPSDNYIRDMLDETDPALLQPCFARMEQLLAAPPLRQAFARLGDRILIAWDGTEYFCSQKLGCPHCLTRKRASGKVESYHTLLAATAVAPGHSKVVPLFPEFIAPQDGAEKQDCERNAAKRWHARHADRLRPLRPVYLGDDLFACQPIVSMLAAAGDDFIFTCKESSHKALYDFIAGAEPERHVETIRKGKAVETRRYRWINGIPLRDGKDAALVNWIGFEIVDRHGNVKYSIAWVTSLPVSKANVADIAACGRARWKIENETFNVMKNHGYERATCRIAVARGIFGSEWRFLRPSARSRLGYFHNETPRRIGRGHASAELLIKNLVAHSRQSFSLAERGTRAAHRDPQAGDHGT